MSQNSECLDITHVTYHAPVAHSKAKAGSLASHIHSTPFKNSEVKIFSEDRRKFFNKKTYYF
jgi:hypothetical protein